MASNMSSVAITDINKTTTMAVLIPTWTYFDKWCKPLLDLGVDSFDQAEKLGLITEKECAQCRHVLQCFLVPTETEFKHIIKERLGQIPT